MNNPTLTIAPSEDRRTVTLLFKSDEAKVMMAVSPTEVDAMINGLATARATLVPPVPTTHVNAPLHMPARVQAVVPAERIGGRRLVLFRHPGFGWLAFEFMNDDGAELAAGLSAIVAADYNTGD